MISLYIHIPFCTKKCPYCHFYVVPNRPLFHRILEEGLALEWERQSPLLAGKEIASIYFGGGTPSLFPEGIGALLARIRKECVLSPDCEITVEANPEECSSSLFETLRSHGVNRLSIGVQSLDDRSLHTIERTHTAKKAREALLAAKRAGFDNMSIDLMYDLPDQTEASWEYTLHQIGELPITHLSLYNLTIEPHTAFYKRRPKQPNSETSLQLLDAAVRTFESIGLKRYEISAFAKPGFQSRHNLGYWTGRPFLGLGPSAFSYWEGKRFQNTAHLQRYARLLREGKSPVDFEEQLPFPQNVHELFAVRLRLLEGAAEDGLPQATLMLIERLIEQGLLKRACRQIQLTEKGLLFYDTIAAEIV